MRWFNFYLLLRLTWLYFYLPLFIFSCNNNLPISEVEVVPTEKIYLELRNIKCSEIGTSVKYIPLRSNKDNLLIGDEIERMIVTAHRIIVLDKNISKTLYTFDTTGALKFKITNYDIVALLDDKITTGYSLTDFGINENNNDLLLYISNPGIIIYFDLSTGKYKRKIKIHPDFIFSKLNLSNNGNLILSNTYTNLSSNDSSPHLCMYDSLGNYRNGWLPAPVNPIVERFSGLCLTSLSSNNNYNNLLFARFGSDTIYSLNGTSLTTKYTLDLSEIEKLDSIYYQHTRFHTMKYKGELLPNGNKGGVFTKIHLTDKYISFQILSPRNTVLSCLFDKKEKKGWLLTGLENDFSGYPIPSFPLYMDYKVYAGYISTTEINDLNKYYKKEVLTSGKSKLFTNDDPVVVLLYLKH